MKPFEWKEALTGNKMCKTYNGMYVLLKADANQDKSIYSKPPKPLIGLIFDNEHPCNTGYWDYDGKHYLGYENLSIMGTLDESELNAFNNSKILKEAFINNKLITWDNCPFSGPVRVTGYLDDMFILSFDKWTCHTSGADMEGLHIVG